MNLEPSIGFEAFSTIIFSTILYWLYPLTYPNNLYSSFRTANFFPFSIRYLNLSICCWGIENFRILASNKSRGLRTVVSLLSSLNRLVAIYLAFLILKYYWRCFSIYYSCAIDSIYILTLINSLSLLMKSAKAWKEGLKLDLFEGGFTADSTFS